MKAHLVKIEPHPINENEQIAFIQVGKVCFDLSAVDNSSLTREEFTKCVNVFVAAPELLEALIELENLAPDGTGEKPTTFDNTLQAAIRKAKAAIAKAKGE